MERGGGDGAGGEEGIVAKCLRDREWMAIVYVFPPLFLLEK